MHAPHRTGSALFLDLCRFFFLVGFALALCMCKVGSFQFRCHLFSLSLVEVFQIAIYSRIVFSMFMKLKKGISLWNLIKIQNDCEMKLLEFLRGFLLLLLFCLALCHFDFLEQLFKLQPPMSSCFEVGLELRICAISALFAPYPFWNGQFIRHRL